MVCLTAGNESCFTLKNIQCLADPEGLGNVSIYNKNKGAEIG